MKRKRLRRTASALLAALLVSISCASAFAAQAPALTDSIRATDDALSHVAEILPGSPDPEKTGPDLSAVLASLERETQRAALHSRASNDLTWGDVCALYPYLPVAEVSVPSYLLGVVSLQTYGVGLYESGYIALFFDQAGRLIPSEKYATTTLQAGQHLVVSADDGSYEIIFLGTITPDSSSGPAPAPGSGLTWSNVLAMYPGHHIDQQKIEPGSLIWMTLALQFSQDGYVVLAFDSTGTAYSFEAMGTAFVAPGDHMAVFRPQGDDVELVGLVDFVNDTSSGSALWTPYPLPAGFPAPVSSSGLSIQTTVAGPALCGVTLAPLSGSPVQVHEVLAGFSKPAGSSCQILSADGSISASTRPVATGDTLVLTAADGSRLTFPVVVTGDVTGAGRINLTQLVRISQGMTGVRPLTGIYLAAADWTKTGGITLTDLVREAKLMTS